MTTLITAGAVVIAVAKGEPVTMWATCVAYSALALMTLAEPTTLGMDGKKVRVVSPALKCLVALVLTLGLGLLVAWRIA